MNQLMMDGIFRKIRNDQSQLGLTFKICDMDLEVGSHHVWETQKTNNVKFSINQNSYR